MAQAGKSRLLPNTVEQPDAWQEMKLGYTQGPFSGQQLSRFVENAPALACEDLGECGTRGTSRKT